MSVQTFDLNSNWHGAFMHPCDGGEFVRYEDYEKLAAAVKAFADKLDEIHNDVRFQSVWTVNQMHCGQYSGPTYEAEFKALKEAV